MHLASRFVSVLCLLAFSTQLAQAKAVCNTPQEVNAVQLQQLRIEMMVSTLRCDSSSYDFRKYYYGPFLEKLNPVLSSTHNTAVLKAMLNRQGKKNIDSYITAMANDAQNISQQDPEYCTKAYQIIDQLPGMEPSSIPAFAAQTIPSPYLVTPCPEHAVAKKKKAKKKQ